MPRRYPLRTRRKPLRLRYPIRETKIPKYFPPLGEEVSNAQRYDVLHKTRYGPSASIIPGTSRLTHKKTNAPSFLPAADPGWNSFPDETVCYTQITEHAPSQVSDRCSRDALDGTPLGSITNTNSSRISSGSSSHRRTVLAIQWNINGFFNNLADLELLVNNMKPVVLALQEIHKASVSSMNNTLKKGYN